eukprot:scaffold46001_cov36-Phaeocystis_antarctica.AAC.1
MAPSRLHQRHRVAGAAPSFGQPRPVRRQPQLRLLCLRGRSAYLDRQRLPRRLHLPRQYQREPRDPTVRPGGQQQ